MSMGQYIKQCRQDAGLTQKQLADALGMEYYNTISQVENDRINLPPAHWRTAANVMQLNVQDFVLKCLNLMQPEMRNAVFGTLPDNEVIKRIAN